MLLSKLIPEADSQMATVVAASSYMGHMITRVDLSTDQDTEDCGAGRRADTV